MKTATAQPLNELKPIPRSLANRYKIAFYSLLALISAFLIGVGYDSGYHSDELDMIAYGKANVKYYESGGMDTTYRQFSLDDGTPVPPTMKYYGSGFEYFSILANKLMGTSDRYEINVRHIINQLACIIALLFSGLLAKRLSGRYEAAIVTLILLSFTPFFMGLAIFDVKDVPLMLGYVASTYFMVVFFGELPRMRWPVIAGLSFFLAFSLSVRLVSILQVIFFGLFLVIKLYELNKAGASQSMLLRILFTAFIAVLIAAILMVASWPYLLESPMKHFSEAINVARNFPQRIPFNFDGEQVLSVDLPGAYIIRSFLVTVPIIVSAVILLFGVFIMINDKKNRFSLLFILAVSLCPVIYAHLTSAPLYNNWRHMLFAYPGLVLLGSLGFVYSFYCVRNIYIKYSLIMLFVFGLIKPAIWMVKQQQYMYMYYNEFVGGFDKAYYNYETDFWQISVKEALDSLVKFYPESKMDSAVLVTNAFSACKYYLSRKHPAIKVSVGRAAAKSFNNQKWNYAIINNLFLPPDYLIDKFPPSFNNQSIINVADKPLTILLKEKSNNRNMGIAMLAANRFAVADSFFTCYMKDQGQDILSTNVNFMGLEGMMAFAKYAAGNKTDGALIAGKAIREAPFDYFLNLVLGIDNYSKKNAAMAVKYLSVAKSVNDGDIMATQLLATIK